MHRNYPPNSISIKQTLWIDSPPGQCATSSCDPRLMDGGCTRPNDNKMATKASSVKSFRSDVWTHFGFLCKPRTQETDKSKMVCKLCQAELKYNSNTANLRNHLSRHHADALQQPMAKPVDSKQTQLDKAFVCKLPPNSVRAQKITKSVAVFICKDLRPYSVVENQGFKKMIHTLEPQYAIIC